MSDYILRSANRFWSNRFNRIWTKALVGLNLLFCAGYCFIATGLFFTGDISISVTLITFFSGVFFSWLGLFVLSDGYEDYNSSRKGA
jgi:hypothetical protein